MAGPQDYSVDLHRTTLEDVGSPRMPMQVESSAFVRLWNLRPNRCRWPLAACGTGLSSSAASPRTAGAPIAGSIENERSAGSPAKRMTCARSCLWPRVRRGTLSFRTRRVAHAAPGLRTPGPHWLIAETSCQIQGRFLPRVASQAKAMLAATAMTTMANVRNAASICQRGAFFDRSACFEWEPLSSAIGISPGMLGVGQTAKDRFDAGCGLTSDPTAPRVKERATGCRGALCAPFRAACVHTSVLIAMPRIGIAGRCVLTATAAVGQICEPEILGIWTPRSFLPVELAPLRLITGASFLSRSHDRRVSKVWI